MADVFGQGAHDIRFDWGLNGAQELGADVSVVVDVLSFSTAVTIAVERGMAVYPFSWKDRRAADFATAHDATLAVGRLESTKPGSVAALSLSPAGLLTCAFESRIVLPSPNGAATAEWLARRLDAGRSIAVIAAGERWQSDDSLRPALEDQLGAGAILSALGSRGYGDRMSPESAAAAALFDALRGRLTDILHRSVGGRELTSKGFAADVDAAAERDVSSVVPILDDGAFGAAT